MSGVKTNAVYDNFHPYKNKENRQKLRSFDFAFYCVAPAFSFSYVQSTRLHSKTFAPCRSQNLLKKTFLPKFRKNLAAH
jgi:hypothetical protein